MILGCAAPPPNTVCVPVRQRSQALQFLAACRNDSSVGFAGINGRGLSTRLATPFRCIEVQGGPPVGVRHCCTPARHNFRISPESMLDRKGKVAENWPRRTKSEVPPSLAARPTHPWLPLHSLPCALKLKPICADELPHPLPIAIATHLN